MRKLYDPAKQKSLAKAAKSMAVEHNVTFNVIDVNTKEIVQTHTGHNAATNTLLTGIAHYLVGDGVYNQAYDMLSMYLPRYISLGTMGLFTQADDSDGLPIGLGSDTDNLTGYDREGNELYYGDPQTERLCHYISEAPGFGADGYDANSNNNRPYFGLGPKFEDRGVKDTIVCELINDSYPRTAIALRDIVPETEAEIPKTIDIVYSGMISTGALAQFRGMDANLQKKTYLFITEAGLWSNRIWTEGSNGLLAAYRIIPPDYRNWDFGTYIEGYTDDDGNWIPGHYDLDNDPEKRNYTGQYDQDGNPILMTHAEFQKQNQETLRKNILRVNRNQVVQVIWKIQIGALEQLGGRSELYPSTENSLVWTLWDEGR